VFEGLYTFAGIRPQTQPFEPSATFVVSVGFTTYTHAHINVTHAHQFFSGIKCDLISPITPDLQKKIQLSSILLKKGDFEQLFAEQKILITSDERSQLVYSRLFNFSHAAGSPACFSIYNSPNICSCRRPNLPSCIRKRRGIYTCEMDQPSLPATSRRVAIP